MPAFDNNPTYTDLNNLFTNTPTNEDGLIAEQFIAFVENTIYLRNQVLDIKAILRSMFSYDEETQTLTITTI